MKCDNDVPNSFPNIVEVGLRLECPTFNTLFERTPVLLVLLLLLTTHRTVWKFAWAFLTKCNCLEISQTDREQQCLHPLHLTFTSPFNGPMLQTPLYPVQRLLSHSYVEPQTVANQPSLVISLISYWPDVKELLISILMLANRSLLLPVLFL